MITIWNSYDLGKYCWKTVLNKITFCFLWFLPWKHTEKDLEMRRNMKYETFLEGLNRAHFLFWRSDIWGGGRR